MISIKSEPKFIGQTADLYLSISKILSFEVKTTTKSISKSKEYVWIPVNYWKKLAEYQTIP